MRNRYGVMAGVLLAIVVMASPSSVRAQSPQFLSSWSTPAAPLGLAVGPDGLLYVGEPAGPSTGLRLYGQDGSAHGVFLTGTEVHGLGFLSSGYLLAAEYVNEYIGVYPLAGGFRRILYWQGVYELYIAVDAQDRAYFTDDRNGQVALARTVGNGQILKQWAVPHPTGICLTNGLVYVASATSGTISSFMPDGTPVGSFPTGATAPQQLATDAAGDLLLADHGLHQLKCFRTDGTLVWTLGPIVPGYPYGTCDFMSVTVSTGGIIFAGDAINHRILRFTPQSTPVGLSSWGRIKALYRK